MILVTGGAGYIGSVVIDNLISRSEQTICLDNLSTGNHSAVNEFAIFARGDVRDSSILEFLFSNYMIEGVIHLAANSLIDDAIADPFAHLDHNVQGSTTILKYAHKYEVEWFLFASSANGNASPYGLSKLITEQMFPWLNFKHGVFRFFNVAGATDRRGEMRRVETHLIPKILNVIERDAELFIYGDDYDTPDGTAIRDYVHVSDIAQAHMDAIKYFRGGGKSFTCNLGSGSGYSVREIITAASEIFGDIPSEIGERRPGDPARLIADTTQAKAILGWEATRDIKEIIQSAWDWRVS